MISYQDERVIMISYQDNERVIMISYQDNERVIMIPIRIMRE